MLWICICGHLIIYICLHIRVCNIILCDYICNSMMFYVSMRGREKLHSTNIDMKQHEVIWGCHCPASSCRDGSFSCSVVNESGITTAEITWNNSLDIPGRWNSLALSCTPAKVSILVQDNLNQETAARAEQNTHTIST